MEGNKTICHMTRQLVSQRWQHFDQGLYFALAWHNIYGRKMFQALLKWLNPRHEWILSEDLERRYCSVCGRREQYLDGDEWHGFYWEMTRAGDRRAHVP
jgi:hypothetical protein